MTGAIAGDGSIIWSSAGVVALGPVQLGIPGLVVTVDPMAPGAVFDVAAASPEGLVARALLFVGDDARRLAAAPESVQRARLTPAATRLATVSCVHDLHLGELDEALVLVDRAWALAGIGESAAAADWLRLAGPSLDRLAERIETDDVVGPLVATAVAALSDFAAAGILPTELAAHLDRLADRQARQDVAFDDGLAAITADAETALALGADETPVPRVTWQLNDLRCLPPRTLAYAGPDHPDLRVVEGDGGTVVVSARLRGGVITDTAELQGLFAVAAEARTGELVAVSPVLVASGEVTAQLQTGGLAPDRLSCALIGSGADPDMVRLDPVGMALTRIDRYLRHAWTAHRTAGAALASAGFGGEQLDRLTQQSGHWRATAVDSAATAQALLRQLRRRHRAGADAEALAVFADSADRFADVVTSEPEITGPVGPTLTELAAVVLG